MSKCEAPGCHFKEEKLNSCSCGRKVCKACYSFELKMCKVCEFYMIKNQLKKERQIQATKNLLKAVINKDFDK